MSFGFLEECVDSFGPAAGEKAIQLQIRSTIRSCSTQVDADRFLQVLGNLIGNALNFTPENGTITVALEPARDSVVISVADTGSGVPPEDLPNLFDRYWQVRKTQEVGTGLGLAIAKAIVGAHGGRIWAESEARKGTTISFTLPLSN